MSAVQVVEATTQSFGDIVISDEASAKILELMNEEKIPGLKLRIFIEGGGCSGFRYGFTFDEDDAADDDAVFIKNGLTVVVDSMSIAYINGAEICYKEDMFGSKFTVNNPNATTTCGCGSSFSA